MLTEQLFDFLAASPSCYHAVQALVERLERSGYAQLPGAGRVDADAGGNTSSRATARRSCPSASRRVRPQAS